MSDINDAIEKAKILDLNCKMEILLNHNLVCMKEKMPAIYDAFANYKETELALYLDTQGYLNLLNTKDNQPVYPMDPGIFADKQIEQYSKKPAVYKFQFSKSTDDLGQIHAQYSDQLVSYYEENSVEIGPRDSFPESIRFMLMMGCGLGLHIGDLLEKTDLKHLCIYEPHMDAFYASLHTTDWQPILEYFSRPGYSIEFCIAMKPYEAMFAIGHMLNREGGFNLVYTYFYKHFDSPEIKEMLDLFLREFHLTALGWGYFDDEQVSLAHTVQNYVNKVPVLNEVYSGSSAVADVPVFIVANGPSLDGYADFLRANHNNIVIISCGTAIGSLYKIGVKPDIHVEIERTRPVVEWIEVGTDPEFRKGIQLVALNPVHPEVFDLFENTCMALKPNDAGAAFMQSNLLEGRTSILLNACNPTVANCGLSLAISLGFKQLYLLGVDLSLKSSDERHSKYSVYSDIDSEVESQIGYQYEDAGNFYKKGNFKEQVLTTAIYDQARANMEILLRNSSLSVHNISDGIYIEGATPLNAVDLDYKLDDKKAMLSDMFETVAYLDSFSEIEGLKEAEDRILYIHDAIHDLGTILNDSVQTKDDVYRVLNNMHKYIRSLEKKSTTLMCYCLLRGSTTYICSLIAIVINDLNGDELFKQYSDCKAIANEFLKEIDVLMKKHPFDLDETRRDLVSNMK